MITIRCDECSEIFFDSRDERRSNLEQLATDTPFEDDVVMCLDCMDEIFEEDEKENKPIQIKKYDDLFKLSKSQLMTICDLIIHHYKPSLPENESQWIRFLNECLKKHVRVEEMKKEMPKNHKIVKVEKPIEKVLRMKEIKELSNGDKISTLFDLRTLLQTEIFTNCWYDEMKENGDIDHDDEELLNNVNAILFDYLNKQWRTE